MAQCRTRELLKHQTKLGKSFCSLAKLIYRSLKCCFADNFTTYSLMAELPPMEKLKLAQNQMKGVKKPNAFAYRETWLRHFTQFLRPHVADR